MPALRQIPVRTVLTSMSSACTLTSIISPADHSPILLLGEAFDTLRRLKSIKGEAIGVKDLMLKWCLVSPSRRLTTHAICESSALCSAALM
ncbi:hypothetical protein PoB_006419000 [Plakobranchus ocellatus]|uniref:Uncharacterized protein n=1 Tax=Plakobranchus ocellatus TaxID=259542 RepID=A0AAV4D0T9_9GAST|nr:hypothetical protein PoB_006419000 [Plakobranchus ocellatus]